MEFQTFVRKPFMIEAVEVTRENIHEISELIGGDLIEENGQDPFIRVESSRYLQFHKVKIGYILSRKDKKYKVYSKEVFGAGFELVVDGLKVVRDESGA